MPPVVSCDGSDRQLSRDLRSERSLAYPLLGGCCLQWSSWFRPELFSYLICGGPLSKDDLKHLVIITVRSGVCLTFGQERDMWWGIVIVLWSSRFRPGFVSYFYFFFLWAGGVEWPIRKSYDVIGVIIMVQSWLCLILASVYCDGALWGDFLWLCG